MWLLPTVAKGLCSDGSHFLPFDEEGSCQPLFCGWLFFGVPVPHAWNRHFLFAKTRNLGLLYRPSGRLEQGCNVTFKNFDFRAGVSSPCRPLPEPYNLKPSADFRPSATSPLSTRIWVAVSKGLPRFSSQASSPLSTIEIKRPPHIFLVRENSPLRTQRSKSSRECRTFTFNEPPLPLRHNEGPSRIPL